MSATWMCERSAPGATRGLVPEGRVRSRIRSGTGGLS